MLTLNGIGTSGFAEGRAFVVKSYTDTAERSYCAKSLEEELHVAKDALRVSKMELEHLAETSDVFAAHFEMADDPMLWDSIEMHIQDDQLNAIEAVDAALADIESAFREIDDEYLKARIDDVADVCQRIKKHVLKAPAENPFERIEEGSVLVAPELFPSDMQLLDFNRLRGIITVKGNRNSHICIMAANKGIPVIVNVNSCLTDIHDGDCLQIDASAGIVCVNPDMVAIENFRKRKEENSAELVHAKHNAHLPALTLSGKLVPVMANAGNVEDVVNAISMGADGIGLFRSEFLYMEKESLPDEEMLFSSYYTAAKACENKPLIIRTLDVGGDKLLKSIDLPKEDNPFLGFRAIRLCLEYVDIFKTQIRAILRAGQLGNVKIMLPLVCTLEDVDNSLQLIEECKRELVAEQKSFDGNMEIGIMIETPSAVLLAPELAKKVSFMSIGTNDLTQYIMVADRGNSHVSSYYQPLNPAVLRAMKMTCNAAHQEGIQVSLCGELASQKEAVRSILLQGVDKLSVNASSVAVAKEEIRKYK